jgi:methanogenic corrinoid protein MtbC1
MAGYNQESLLRDIIAARMDEAVLSLREEALQTGYPRLIQDLLDPVLRRIGGMWSDGSISLAQSYVAGRIAETILDDSVAQAAESPTTISRGTVVIGNIEDDYHALGRRMVCAFLRLDGWNVVDLGNDVQPADFIKAALDNKASIIGVSAMMLTTALNILPLHMELKVRGLRGSIKLAVGGAIFRMRPELVEEVGGDGSADSAMEAPALFRCLQAETGR